MSPDADADTPAVADAVVAAVLAVPGVVRLHGGAFGEVATYLPGRRVAGVRLDGPRCEVHVAVALGAPVADTAELVRQRVRALVPGPVDVTIEDVLTEDPSTEPRQGTP